MYLSSIRKNSDMNFFSLLQNIKNISFFFIFGTLTSNPGAPNFRHELITEQTYVQEGQNCYQFFMYGPKCEICAVLIIRGGGTGLPFINQVGPILFPSYPLAYSNLDIKYGNDLLMIA